MEPNKSSTDIFLYKRHIDKSPDLNMWFVFPGPESFALSSIGYMWLYKSIDELSNINIERVNSDTTSTSIIQSNVDVIAFSLSFDMDFLEVLKFMDEHNYNFRSKMRTESDPLIYAGGPVITSNPIPYSKIFDFMVIGDGETINTEIVQILAQNRHLSKTEKLNILSKMDGIYVPTIKQEKVNKITQKLSTCIYTPIISENAFFKNTFIVEVERGCANRCAFCLASYNNLPIRFAPKDEILKAIDLGLSKTNKIALLGAQVTSHPQFNEICNYIHQKIKNGEKIEMSVSSLRVDAFKQDIVQTLVDAGQKNLTLAIEAGSERLRKVINKNITEGQILDAIETGYKCGLKGIKLYGMLGIPTETDSDIQEVIDLSKRIKTKYKSFNISFGFSTFVPKANTPFQWLGREPEKSLEKKSAYIKKELHKLGIEVSISSIKWDYYQAVLSRGDEKLTELLIQAYELGGKLGAFKKAAKNSNIDTDYYANENYSFDKKLPWDKISIDPGKEFLKNECRNLLKN